MNRFRKSLVALTAAVPLMLLLSFQARGAAPGPKVSEDMNKHNLSSAVYALTPPSWNVEHAPIKIGRDSSIKYRATYNTTYNPLDPSANAQGRQICIFCHTPHTANVTEGAPLWNRSFSPLTFSRYSSATLQIRVNPAVSASNMANYGPGKQPDGSSKLCLSCHDGLPTANGGGLGNVLRGGPIKMDSSNGGGDVITGRASFNPSTNKMKTGHHPISFVYNGAIQTAISSGRKAAGLGGGFGFTLPSGLSKVKLDKNSKMQCTTCHDPHQNQSDDTACYDPANGNALATCGSPATADRKVVPFWVLHNGSNNATQDHDDVCTSCHNMNSPKPWL